VDDTTETSALSETVPVDNRSLLQAIDHCIVVNCGAEDDAFIAAVEAGGTVTANAEGVARAILAMPEMHAIRVYVHWWTLTHAVRPPSTLLPDSVYEWVMGG